MATTVVYGQVTPNESPGNFNTDVNTFWEDYMIVNRYERDNHIYMGGMTSPTAFQGSSVAFYQLSAPTLLWMADWTASQWLSSPVIPDTLTGDSNWVLLDITNIEAAMLGISPDGQSNLYRLSATYVYGHRNPNPTVWYNLSYPRPPWLKDVYDRTIPVANLTQSLIDGGGIVVGKGQVPGQFVGK